MVESTSSRRIKEKEKRNFPKSRKTTLGGLQKAEADKT